MKIGIANAAVLAVLAYSRWRFVRFAVCVRQC